MKDPMWITAFRILHITFGFAAFLIAPVALALAREQGAALVTCFIRQVSLSYKYEGGRMTIDSDLAVETLEKYVSMFHGDPPLAGARLVRYNEDERALADGHFVMMLAPDWQLGFYKSNQGDVLRGKLRVMPLPAWTRGGRRTR